MTIATRQSGFIGYRHEGETRFAKVEAVVVSDGVFVANMLATSVNGSDFTELDEPIDIMYPVGDFCWYLSEDEGDPS